MKHLLSLVGVVLAGVFGRALYLALNHPPIDKVQVYTLALLFGVGMLLIEGVSSTLAAGLTAVGAAVGKYLPWMKGGT